MQQGKKKKGIEKAKKEFKFHYCLCRKYDRTYKMVLKLISEFSKAEGYNINIKINCTCTYQTLSEMKY